MVGHIAETFGQQGGAARSHVGVHVGETEGVVMETAGVLVETPAIQPL